MGKKDNKKKQGRGEEKTRQKSEAKAAKRTKKAAAAKGEEDVEALIAEFVAKDKKRAAVNVETGCAQPSVRSSFSLTANPVKDELLLFGGEYYNGKQTFLYNDLFAYGFKRGGEWSLIRSPNPPPPRCSHQAVAVPQSGGQLWIFGGEFASPSQSQFYHYNDLWCLSLADYQWSKHEGPGRPSPRSGHRMIAWRKLLIVFGGFHEVHDTFKYFNDVHAFSLETYQWLKLEISGTPPSPRSGCQLALNKQGKIVVYGGYSKSKVKKDTERGIIHSDMFTLAPLEKTDTGDEPDKVPTKWKWTSIRQSGDKPTPRSGFSLLPYSQAPGSAGFARALLFGGVRDDDDEDDDTNLKSHFFNDMFTLDLETGKWFELFLRGERPQGEAKKSRRRRKSEKDGDEGEEEEEEGDVKKLKIDEEDDDVDDASSNDASAPSKEVSASAPEQIVSDDGIFTVSVGVDEAASSSDAAAASDGAQRSLARSANAFVPEPRMNAQLVLKNNVAYLYGGLEEDGDKTLTLRDFYSLDMGKLDTWRTIARDEREREEWAEESESSEEEEEEEGAEGGEEEDEDEDGFEEFWEENRARFLELAGKELEESEQKDVTKKMIKNRAFQLAREEYGE